MVELKRVEIKHAIPCMVSSDFFPFVSVVVMGKRSKRTAFSNSTANIHK